MKILKPQWVYHATDEEKRGAGAIYGVDLDPSGKRFATGGGDNAVRLWALSPVLSEVDEADSTKPKLLATIRDHQSSVNAVRWSHNGRFLASSSDDHLVMVYEQKPGPPPPKAFGSDDADNVEHWGRRSVLRGHNMDVVDIAWSPDDLKLASCSIDNTVCIWAMDDASSRNPFSAPLHTLKGHNSWVKGVVWDPVGKYLATAGEDKALIFWRVEDWQEEIRIEEPFLKGSASSHFRRLSWSPDGISICATHAFKSKQNVAAIIERGSWSNDVDFVGHRSPVAAARFNPRIFLKKPLKTEISSETKVFSCCAIGSYDCSISIWASHSGRPIAVLRDCFDSAVVDISWSRDGFTMIACSLDGSVCAFMFDSSELGIPLSDDQQHRFMRSKYGANIGATSSSILIENASQLRMEAAGKAVKRKITDIMPQGPHTPPRVIAQTISVMKGGKKRITPALITGPQAGNGVSSPGLLSSRMEGGRDPSSVSSSSPPLSLARQVPTANPVKRTVSTKYVNVPVYRLGEDPQLVPLFSLPVLNHGASHSSFLRFKMGEDVFVPLLPTSCGPEAASDVALSPIEENVSLSGHVSLQCKVHLPQEGEEGREALPVVSTVSCIMSSPPLSLPPPPATAGNGSTAGSEGGGSRKSTLLWKDRIPGRACCSVGNASFMAVGCTDGTLFIYSASGRRLFPAIILGERISFLECSPGASPYLLVIKQSGALICWDLARRTTDLSCSLSPLLTSAQTGLPATAGLQNVQVSAVSITRKGIPIVTLAVGSPAHPVLRQLNSFTYDRALQSWLRVADQSFLSSDFFSSLPPRTSGLLPSGPLSRLQAAAAMSRLRSRTARLLLMEDDMEMQKVVTRSHLEHQVAAALALQSEKEYKEWLLMYVRYLAEEEDILRLRELFDDFTGPPECPPALKEADGEKKSGEKGIWEASVLGLDKRALLREELLPLLSTNRHLQRLLHEYMTALDELPQERATETADI